MRGGGKYKGRERRENKQESIWREKEKKRENLNECNRMKNI